MQRKMTLKVAQFFLYIAQSSKTFLQVFLMLPIMMGAFPTTLNGTIDNISRINNVFQFSATLGKICCAAQWK